MSEAQGGKILPIGFAAEYLCASLLEGNPRRASLAGFDA